MESTRFVVWALLPSQNEGRGSAPSVRWVNHPSGVDAHSLVDDRWRGEPVTPPLPIVYSEQLRHVLGHGLRSFVSGGPRIFRPSPWRRMQRWARRHVRWWLGSDYEGDGYERVFSRPAQTDESDVAGHVGAVLAGRSLMTREIQRALMERGVAADGALLDDVLALLAADGRVERLPAVAPDAGDGGYERLHDAGLSVTPSPRLRGEAPPWWQWPVHRWPWRCNRCGSAHVRLIPCSFCRLQSCPRCVTCDSLGAATGCTPLYRQKVGGENPDRDAHRPAAKSRPSVSVHLPFKLSKHQQDVSDTLVQTTQDVLIWAACGAGKTETVLSLMRQTVVDGGRVLFAVPRRDVVVQLGERFMDALPGADVVTLTGDTPEKYASAAIVVATVHQALRFYRAFDVVVVDEIDAFPLNTETWLLQALARALKPAGRRVMMTATPPDRLTYRVARGDVTLLTLPGRPHGHPLPVPTIVRDARLLRARAPSAKAGPMAVWRDVLTPYVEQSVGDERRLMVFVPAVALTEPVRASLPLHVTASRRPIKSAAVSAADARRREKVQAFLNGALDCIVCTTILERGVTAPFVDVVVFMADSERLFDAASLIQMAGRVGRSFDDPSGRVTFVAGTVTAAMREAVDTITRMNTLFTQH